MEAPVIAVAPPDEARQVPAARPLLDVTEPVDPEFARARHKSPLRYPGAKRGLAPVVKSLVAGYGRTVELFVEPFVGGASTSLELLTAGIVKRALLADADPIVASFWRAAAESPQELIDRIAEEHRTYIAVGGATAVERWDYWRGFESHAGQGSQARTLDLATKCLFLNRTTFSGILHGGAGPIGGRRQTSENTIGCRFNLDRITGLLEQIGKLYDQGRIADVWEGDWETTLKQVSSSYKALLPDSVIAYLDPPYLRKAGKLYARSFAEPSGGRGDPHLDWSSAGEHLRLAEYLRRFARYRWILSYDFHPGLLNDAGLYAAGRMTPSVETRETEGVRQWFISKGLVELRYTASAKNGRRNAPELVVTTLPPSVVASVPGFLAIEPAN